MAVLATWGISAQATTTCPSVYSVLFATQRLTRFTLRGSIRYDVASQTRNWQATMGIVSGIVYGRGTLIQALVLSVEVVYRKNVGARCVADL